ncbi:hypothetical protein [Cupriavidus basilensis]
MERGLLQLILAGGATSGACVQAPQVQQIRIAPQSTRECPSVTPSPPAGTDEVLPAPKSGNF